MNAWPVTPAAGIAANAVLELLSATEPGAFGPHFRHPRTLTKNAEPDPLHAARAAYALSRAVQRQVVHQSLRARGVGESWEAVATTLDLTAEAGPDVVTAYLMMLGNRLDDPWWSPSTGVTWTCSSCEESIRDFGPECGGPEDREAGHAATCSRHLAAVAAWDALWT